MRADGCSAQACFICNRWGRRGLAARLSGTSEYSMTCRGQGQRCTITTLRSPQRGDGAARQGCATLHTAPVWAPPTLCSKHPWPSTKQPRCVAHRAAMLNGTVVALFNVGPLPPAAGLNPIDQRDGLLQAPAGAALVSEPVGSNRILQPCQGPASCCHRERKG